MSWFDDMLAFHRKFGTTISATPTIPDKPTQKLRKNLIKEEYKELRKALKKKDLVEIADGGIDLIYVILGTLVSYGIDADAVWKEVQRTNMEKVGGKKRADGKILKPSGWKPPRIKYVLDHQKPLFKLRKAVHNGKGRP